MSDNLATYPNDFGATDDPATFDPLQAAPESVEYQAVQAALEGTGVISGVTLAQAGAMDVIVAAGLISVRSQQIAIAATTLTFAGNATGWTRRDSVRGDGSGVYIVEGQPSPIPVSKPLRRDSDGHVDEVLLATVLVPPGAPEGILDEHITLQGVPPASGITAADFRAVTFEPLHIADDGTYAYSAGGGPVNQYLVTDLNADGQIDDAHDGTMYTLHLNTQLQPAISKKSPSDTGWRRVILDPTHLGGFNPLSEPVQTDGHNVIALGMDNEGFLHAAGNTHNGYIKYMHSKYSMRDPDHPYSIDQWSFTPGNGTLPDNLLNDQNDRQVSFPAFLILPNGAFVYFASQIGHPGGSVDGAFGTRSGGGDGDANFSMKLWHPNIDTGTGLNTGTWEELGADIVAGERAYEFVGTNPRAMLVCSNEHVTLHDPGGPADYTYSPFPLSFCVDAESRVHVVLDFRSGTSVTASCGWYYFCVDGLAPGATNADIRCLKSDLVTEIDLPMAPPGDPAITDPTSHAGGNGGLVRALTFTNAGGNIWTGSNTTHYPQSHWVELIVPFASADSDGYLTTNSGGGPQGTAATTEDIRPTGIINESTVQQLQPCDPAGGFHGTFMAIDAADRIQQQHIWRDADKQWHVDQITSFQADTPPASWATSGTPLGSATRMRVLCTPDGNVYAFGSWPADGFGGVCWCYDLTPDPAFVPATTTVAAGSNGVELKVFDGSKDATLHVVDTGGYPGGGSVDVMTDSGFAYEITYAYKTATTFERCVAAYAVSNPLWGGLGCGQLVTGAAVTQKQPRRPPFKIHGLPDHNDINYDLRPAYGNQLAMLVMSSSRYWNNPGIHGGDGYANAGPTYAGFPFSDLDDPVALVGVVRVDLKQIDLLRNGIAKLPTMKFLRGVGGNNIFDIAANDFTGLEDILKGKLHTDLTTAAAGGVGSSIPIWDASTDYGTATNGHPAGFLVRAPAGNKDIYASTNQAHNIGHAPAAPSPTYWTFHAAGSTAGAQWVTHGGSHQDLVLGQDTRGKLLFARLTAMFDVDTHFMGVCMRAQRTELSNPQNHVINAASADIPVWSSAVTYAQGDLAIAPGNGEVYASQINGNIGHPPAISPNTWKPHPAGIVTTRIGCIVNFPTDPTQDVAQTGLVALDLFSNYPGGAYGRIFVEAIVGNGSTGQLYVYNMELYELDYQ